ncbi:hypothetical protein RJ639_024252 [Escallonia herrerae]|uniref:Uncharacterized protein n=1 Tax=Escallonia herrerae TaxID=1293975 RepID=A0AA88V008_9ASTE|nr:hypothetical protein RJ639_024252 [Escallonia herrerae]
MATSFSRSLLNGESAAANVDQAMDPRASASNGRHSNSRPRPRTGVLDLQLRQGLAQMHALLVFLAWMKEPTKSHAIVWVLK